jgi:Xaa-Pro aminopeptidase
LARKSSSRPSRFIAPRLDACRAKIHEFSVSGYLITNRVDQYYLTGFDGEDGAALILPNQVYLLTDGRFVEEAERDVPWAKRAVRRTERLPELLGQLARSLRLKTLGFQPSAVSVDTFTAFRKQCKPTQLVSMPPILDELRVIKDSSEVKTLQKAIEVAEEAFRTLLRRIKIGWTERQVAAELQYEIVRRGASGTSFPLIVAEGPNSSLPHARPGDRKLREGSVLLIDWGATFNHYRSDLTRVVFIRRIPPRFRRMYEQVLAAQTAAIDLIRPGARMDDVDGAARKALKKAGMDRNFTHGLGHGIGLDIHEAPRLARNMTGLLQPGMVVTVEPGVYYPGIGGVRIEDDVLVTPEGCRVLTHLSRDIDAMVVS